MEKWPEWISAEAVLNTPNEVMWRVFPGHQIIRTTYWYEAYFDPSEPHDNWPSDWNSADWEWLDKFYEWEVDENWEADKEWVADKEHAFRWLVNILGIWKHRREDWDSTVFSDFQGAREWDDNAFPDADEGEDQGLAYADEELTKIEGPYAEQMADLAWRHSKQTPNP